MQSHNKLTHDDYLKRLKEKQPNIIPVETYISHRDKIKHKCVECGGEFIASPNFILKNNTNRCPYCTNRKVLVGFNDILTTHPEIADLLVNEADKTNYTFVTSTKLKFKCKICDKIYETIPNYVSSDSCKFCRDGISYPEKFMLGFLDQVNVNYIYQLSSVDFSWCKSYRYDFYFELNGESYIIETNGSQHYCTSNKTSVFGSAEENMINDKNKKDLAEQYVDHYIVIDCRRSEMKYLENAIKNSELSEIFDMNSISFKKCQMNVLTSIKIKVCEAYQSGMKPKEIREKYHLSRSAVSSYLKQGSNAGLCDYTPEKCNLKVKATQIICLDNMEVFDKIADAVNKYNISAGTIMSSCKEHRSVASECGLHRWMYLSEYNSISEIPNYTLDDNYHRKVKCVNTGVIFDSISDACKWANISNQSNIRRSIKTKNGTCGYHPITGERLSWTFNLKEGE